jgi:hypothetical protein
MLVRLRHLLVRIAALADQLETINMSVVVPMNGLEQTAKSKMHVQVHLVKTQELVDQLVITFLNVHVHLDSLESDAKLQIHVSRTHV